MSEKMGAKARILARLRAAPQQARPAATAEEYAVAQVGWRFDSTERAHRFKALLSAVQTEIYDCTQANWPQKLAELAVAQGWRNLLLPAHSPLNLAIEQAWHDSVSALPRLQRYEQAIEGWREALFFETDAAITGCHAAIAATGSIVLWPSVDEPRLMSLVPPVHVVVVKQSQLADNWLDLMQQQQWQQQMPTNVVLVSGPSKTSDIQRVTAYGAHGPKALIVLFLTDC